ncbi:tetrathionate reductase family octaheme c-type cytochrome [Vibrio sp. HN007]|uniref:tetrathionate reductase family octaheme c-type cytochrome n=1 Tax=Vibrio iocasae TaxID=3098914 RepID=UPI0035D4E394
MKKLITLVVGLFVIFAGSFANAGGQEVKVEKRQPSSVASTADHSTFDVLDDEFDYAPDVTLACLECHTEAAKQIHSTFHWTWAKEVDGVMVGKAQNGFNNYCVSAKGNESCTQCHVGYGWRNEDFDLEEEENVDCLVCHDTTGTYKKSSASSGHPFYEDKIVNGKVVQKAVDLSYVAQHVGVPERDNCLACHANGGGGNGVKHGDTDMSLVNPDFDLDVHMSPEKLDFSCQDCHTADEHKISGRYNDRKAFIDHDLNMGRPEREGNNVSCESCHSETPHNDRDIDNHTAKVACASCHIPEMARGPYLTKLSWDWSTAGQKKDGKGYVINEMFDGVENIAYTSKKGTFTWGKNVVPEYRWYKGELKQMTYLDIFDPKDAPIDVNPPTGDYNDPEAKIWPFKIHRGKQPYDAEQNHMLPIKLYGKKGTGALWTELDWAKALDAGAKLNHIDYSGKYDFIETNGYWPIKHMVAPAKDTVKCGQCHSRQSRLEGLNDFYLVGRDSYTIVEVIGALMIFGVLAGVVVHALIRISTIRRRKAAQK